MTQIVASNYRTALSRYARDKYLRPKFQVTLTIRCIRTHKHGWELGPYPGLHHCSAAKCTSTKFVKAGQKP